MGIFLMVLLQHVDQELSDEGSSGERDPALLSRGQPDKEQHLMKTAKFSGHSGSAPWGPTLRSMPSVPLWTSSWSHLIFLCPLLYREADLGRRHHWASLPTSFQLHLGSREAPAGDGRAGSSCSSSGADPGPST